MIAKMYDKSASKDVQVPETTRVVQDCYVQCSSGVENLSSRKSWKCKSAPDHCSKLKQAATSIFVIIFINLCSNSKSATCSHSSISHYDHIQPHLANSTGATIQNSSLPSPSYTPSIDTHQLDHFNENVKRFLRGFVRHNLNDEIDECLRKRKYFDLFLYGVNEIIGFIMGAPEVGKAEKKLTSLSLNLDELSNVFLKLTRVKRDLFNDLDSTRNDDDRGENGSSSSFDDTEGNLVEREVTQAPITIQPTTSAPHLIQSIYPEPNSPRVTHLNMTDSDSKQTADDEIGDDQVSKTGATNHSHAPRRRPSSVGNRSIGSDSATTEQSPYSRVDAVLESPVRGDSSGDQLDSSNYGGQTVLSSNGLAEENSINQMRDFRRLNLNDSHSLKPSSRHRNHRLSSRVPSPAPSTVVEDVDMQNQRYNNYSAELNDDNQANEQYATIGGIQQDNVNSSRLTSGDNLSQGGNVPQVGDASVLLEHSKENDHHKNAPKTFKHQTLDEFAMQTNHLHANPPYTAVGQIDDEVSLLQHQQPRRMTRHNNRHQPPFLPWQSPMHIEQQQSHTNNNKINSIPARTFPFIQPVKGPKIRLQHTTPVPNYSGHNVLVHNRDNRVPRSTVIPLAASSHSIASHKELTSKFSPKKPRGATLEDRQQLPNDGVMSLIGQLVNEKKQRGPIASADQDQISSQDLPQNDQYSMMNPPAAAVPSSQILGMVRGGPPVTSINQHQSNTALVRRRGSPSAMAIPSTMNFASAAGPVSGAGNYRLMQTMALPYVLPSYSPSGTSTKYMPIQRNTQYQHRTGRVANSGANYDDSQGAQASVQTTSTSDPMWSDTQNQEDDYQQSPQTIQITAVPNGLAGFNGVGTGLNGFNGLAGWGGGWNGLPWAGANPWGNGRVLLVNKQPTAGVGAEWRSWMLPVAIILSLPLILGALFVPVFLKSVMFLIQILQMLGLLMPPSQIASHFVSGSHSPPSG